MPTVADLVLIGLCTYCRQQLLAEAMQSLTELHLPPRLRVELTVVDNDASRSAFEIVDRAKEHLAFPLEYLVETRRGISFARNRVIERGLKKRARAIAFFDDDARVAPDWLACLHSYYLQEKVEVVTGPQYPIFQSQTPAWAKRSVFFQALSFPTGTLRPWAATHNVLFDITLIKDMGLRFDTDFALSGGEDQFFFMQAVQGGARIKWLQEAVVREMVPLERTQLKWVLRRNFRYSCSGAKFYLGLFGWKGHAVSLAKGWLYLSYGFLFLLPATTLCWFPEKRHHAVKALAYMSRGMGWFAGWLGFCYEEYR